MMLFPKYQSGLIRQWRKGRLFFAGCAAVAVLLGVAPDGYGINTLKVDMVSGYQSGDNAEYNITSTDSALNPVTLGYDAKAIVNGGFESFCLEYNQFVTAGATYHYDISGAAIPGGGGAVGGSDPISIGTALLYLEFSTGTLSGYNYTPGSGREASALALQKAIWWLEDEITLSNPGGNIFLSQLGNLSNAKLDNNGFYNVGVLNLGPSPTYPNQDLLVMRPQVTPFNVPDGGITLLLLGISMGGLFLFRRSTE